MCRWWADRLAFQKHLPNARARTSCVSPGLSFRPSAADPWTWLGRVLERSLLVLSPPCAQIQP